jgi:hypothetical protein
MVVPPPPGCKTIPLGWTGPIPAHYQMVSRWIGEPEVPLWLARNGNTVPPEVGAGGHLSVTEYGAARVAGAGPIRLDFAFPTQGLHQGGQAEWRFIIQPVVNTPIYNVAFHVPSNIDFERLRRRVR